jgi:hypothetical protein
MTCTGSRDGVGWIVCFAGTAARPGRARSRRIAKYSKIELGAGGQKAETIEARHEEYLARD